MRILIISNYYPPFEIGGWEQLTADVAAALMTRGHIVHVMTSRYRAEELTAVEHGVERILHLESPDHIHYQLKYSLRAGRWERENKQYLAKRVKAFSPDIVFINGMWNLPRTLALEAERLCPKRVVYYMASPWPAEPDAHRAYWHLPAEHSWRQRPKRLLRWVLERWLLPNQAGIKPAFHRVLCVSKYMRGFIAEEIGVPLDNIRVVYNGIDPAAFLPKAVSDGSGHNRELRLLYAGQLRADKGVHTAVEGVGRFSQENPSIPVSLTIYGGGPPEYLADLRERIERLNMNGFVRLAGQIPREEMPAVMAEHDVLLFPSIWPEPLARVVQEAMAAGLVVIGTKTGGTPELLKDGETGLAFEAEDVLGLARQIGRAAGDPKLRERLSQAARETVEHCFTQDRMVDEIENYFFNLFPNKIERRPNVERQHLFILCSHSSGSTALWRLLQTSRHVSAMPVEGQFIEGVESILRKAPWKESSELPWEKIRAEWYKVWDLDKPILLEKSPPHLLRAEAVEQNFENAHFIVMVRNPYAFCEGTKRRGRVGLGYGRNGTYTEIAKGWVRESEYQLQNLSRLNKVMLLTYEELVESPAQAVSRLLVFIPGLEYLEEESTFLIHSLSGWLENPLTNFNEMQIARLSSQEIAEINAVLKEYPVLMARFGYKLMEGAYSAPLRWRLAVSTFFTKYVTRITQRLVRKFQKTRLGTH